MAHGDRQAALEGVRQTLEDQLIAVTERDLPVAMAEAADYAQTVESLAGAIARLPEPTPSPPVDPEQLGAVVWQAATSAGASTEIADAVSDAVQAEVSPRYMAHG